MKILKFSSVKIRSIDKRDLHNEEICDKSLKLDNIFRDIALYSGSIIESTTIIEVTVILDLKKYQILIQQIYHKNYLYVL